MGFDGRTPAARRPYHLPEIRGAFAQGRQPVGSARRADRPACFLEAPKRKKKGGFGVVRRQRASATPTDL